MLNNKTKTFFYFIIKNSSNISIREKQVIAKRLNNEGLKEIGSYFGIEKERVRQVEAKALRKLQHYLIRKNEYIKNPSDLYHTKMNDFIDIL